MSEELLLDMKKIPLGWPLMAEAFIGLVRHSLSDEKTIAKFERDTGCKHFAPRNGLEAMIDESAGYGREYLSKFMDWLVVNSWGEEEITNSKNKHDK